MKLAIIGSRNFHNYKILKEEVDKLRKEYEINEIVSGGAIGADKLAEKYAKENNLKLTIFKPEWDKYGKAAGIIRNEGIWKYCDIGIAFWDGKSKGTQHSFQLSKKYNKFLKVVLFEK
jgi:hypothetical protein